MFGTLWKAEASASALFASIYDSFVKGIGVEELMKTNLIASAWHDDMVEVRKLDLDEVVTWATYVHFGRRDRNCNSSKYETKA